MGYFTITTRFHAVCGELEKSLLLGSAGRLRM
jgi:hypothetical protein